jgi:hypothetical protein
VLAVAEDGARIKFLRGGEHTAPLDEVRPCTFLPGQRLVCHWPWWGEWTCTLVSYDAAKQRVKLSDGWGETKWFPVAEVWLPRRRPPGARNRARVYATLLGAGAGLGALLGSLVTALLMP